MCVCVGELTVTARDTLASPVMTPLPPPSISAYMHRTILTTTERIAVKRESVEYKKERAMSAPRDAENQKYPSGV